MKYYKLVACKQYKVYFLQSGQLERCEGGVVRVGVGFTGEVSGSQCVQTTQDGSASLLRAWPLPQGQTA